MMRLKLTSLMQEQKCSVYTRLSLSLHITNLEKEQGDEMVKHLIEMIERGTTEQEIRKIAQEKYGVAFSKTE